MPVGEVHEQCAYACIFCASVCRPACVHLPVLQVFWEFSQRAVCLLRLALTAEAAQTTWLPCYAILTHTAPHQQAQAYRFHDCNILKFQAEGLHFMCSKNNYCDASTLHMAIAASPCSREPCRQRHAWAPIWGPCAGVLLPWSARAALSQIPLTMPTCLFACRIRSSGNQFDSMTVQSSTPALPCLLQRFLSTLASFEMRV